MSFAKTLAASEVSDLVKQLFNIFLQLRIKRRINVKDVLEFLRVDVKLLKEGNCYVVQISNCGRWKTEHYETILRIMHPFCTKFILKTANNLSYGEVVYTEDKASLNTKKLDKEDTNKFPYLKEYLSVKLKPSIHFCNVRAFEEPLLQEISSLKNLNPEVKFTYFRDSTILYNNRVELDNDYESCCLLSSAMCKMIKQSFREEFRRECLLLFGVTNLEDMDYAIKSILLPKIHKNYIKMTVQILRDINGTEKYF